MGSIILLLKGNTQPPFKKPTRWVTVVDSRSGHVILGLPLVYEEVRRPYLIVGNVVESRDYVSRKDGKAFVPSGVQMVPSGSSGYVFDESKYVGMSSAGIIKHGTVYVHRY